MSTVQAEPYPREEAVDLSQRPDPTLPGGLPTFFVVIGLLNALRVALGFISLPLSALDTVNTLLAVLFVAVPVLACFFGANSRWRPSLAGLVLGCGVLAQVLFTFLTYKTQGALSGVMNALAQMGLATWCVGLGGLLGSGLRDKNLIVPVAIFGAAYDFYLVLTPAGITNKVMEAAPKILQNVAAQVPSVSAHAATGKAEVMTYVGPADLVFLSAFFVVIFRFKMNPRLTLALMAPVLVAYMLAVLKFELALPALVPIGTCVLIANWRYFKLSRDEILSTVVLAALCCGLILWSLSRRKPEPAPTPAPSPQAAAPAPGGSARKPVTAGPSSRPSLRPIAPGNKPSPP